MSVSDALQKAYYDALTGEESTCTLPVYSAPPDDVDAYIFIAFDLGGNDGTKSGKMYTKRIGIEVHVKNDNYAAGRLAANTEMGLVEATLWPTVGSVIPMDDYTMVSQNVVEQGADDVLYSVARIIRVYTIFEVIIEPN